MTVINVIQIPENVKPAEIIEDSDTLRVARLSIARDPQYGIQELLAFLGAGGVELHVLFSQRKPKTFLLDIKEMDTLAVAWLLFRKDCAEREASEQAEHEAELANLVANCTARAKAVGVELRHEADEWYTLCFTGISRWFDYFSSPSTYINLGTVSHRLSIIEETLHAEYAHEAALEIGELMRRHEAGDNA